MGSRGVRRRCRGARSVPGETDRRARAAEGRARGAVPGRPPVVPAPAGRARPRDVRGGRSELKRHPPASIIGPMPKVTMSGADPREVNEGSAVGEVLPADAICARVDGQLVDMTWPVTADVDVA